jgi:hypothetical protein
LTFTLSQPILLTFSPPILALSNVEWYWAGYWGLKFTGKSRGNLPMAEKLPSMLKSIGEKFPKNYNSISRI